MFRPIASLRPLAYAVLLISAVTALYAPFLHNALIFDDYNLFVGGKNLLLDADNIRTIGHTIQWLTPRWLPYASLAWTAEFYGLDLVALRTVSLLLHTASAVALFALLRQWLELIDAETAPARRDTAAFLAALLFALHPVATYGAGYLIQRTIVMATLFGSVMLTAHLYALKSGRWLVLLIAVIAYWLAVFSKEHAIMLAAVAAGLSLYFRAQSKLNFKYLISVNLVYLAIAILVVLLCRGIIATPYEFAASDMLREQGGSYGLSALTQASLYFKYLFLWGLPNPAWMSVDMRENFAAAWLSWPQSLGAFMYLAYGAGAGYVLYRGGRWAGLALAALFPWLLFWTEFSTIRIQEIFVLYRSYLWMSGFMLAPALLLQRLNLRHQYMIAASLAILLSVFSLERLATLGHPYLVWDDAAKLIDNPEQANWAWRIYYNRGNARKNLQEYREAIADYDIAIKLRPNNKYIHNNRAAAQLALGNLNAALSDFNQSIGLDPNHATAYEGRADILRRRGEHAAARADDQMSCRLGGRGCDRL